MTDYEVKEIFRIRAHLTEDDKVAWYEVYNSERKVTGRWYNRAADKIVNFFRINVVHVEIENDAVCIVPAFMDPTAHTAQMIADALNLKLSNALAGLGADPWELPVKLDA